MESEHALWIEYVQIFFFPLNSNSFGKKIEEKALLVGLDGPVESEETSWKFILAIFELYPTIHNIITES